MRRKKKGNVTATHSTKKSLKRGQRGLTARRLHDLHLGDARHLARELPANSISVTITSPPYFDLKDYGSKNQIGYGQSYEKYLEDLTAVFKEIFRATRRKGSLWIVVDTFRRGQEVFPLPFDLAGRLKNAGWTLRDVIIWKKDRTLPWVHEGKTKKIFEYVLVFGKAGKPFRYFPNKVRNHADLRRWWVRYPERYNPGGKALEEIWNFDIPVQGSWDQNRDQQRHYCPLPGQLVRRILDLTTSRGETVLDPFAGTGVVLTESEAKGRKAIGFELNYSYIRRFRASRKENLARARSIATNASDAPDSFKQLIEKLRILKFGRLLYRRLIRLSAGKNLEHVFIRKLRDHDVPRNKLYAAEYVLYGPKLSDSRLLDKARAISEKRPLSKFGVVPIIRISRRSSNVPRAYARANLFTYSSTNSHEFGSLLKFPAAIASNAPIISLIRAKVEEPDE